MQTIATALSPFIRHSIKIMIGAVWVTSAAVVVSLSPLWTCEAACGAERGRGRPVDERMAALLSCHTPVGSMSARETLELQLGALRSNAALGDDLGIRYAFALASHDNRVSTGPYARFAVMVKTHYAPLLAAQTVEVEPLGGCVKRASFLVHVIDHQRSKTSYRWSLSRRTTDEAWATDSVLEVSADDANVEPSALESDRGDSSRDGAWWLENRANRAAGDDSVVVQDGDA